MKYQTVWLTLLLTGFGSVAYPETIYGESFSGSGVYHSSSTPKKTPRGYKEWELTSYSKDMQIEGMSYRSIRDQTEYHCYKGIARSLDTIYYAEPMGKGRIVYETTTSDEWFILEPDTAPYRDFIRLCQKGSTSQ